MKIIAPNPGWKIGIGNIQKNKYLIGIGRLFENDKLPLISEVSQASITLSMVWKFASFSNPKPGKLNME